VTNDAPLLSLIVPAHNEERYLPRLLDTVDRARAAYVRGCDSVEVIVADNVSTDATADVARRRGCRVVTVAERRIATVRNHGAAEARGPVLAFVDADLLIHEQSFNVLDRALGNPHIVAGATGVRLERWSLGIALTYALMVPWVVLLRMDTGLVFCRRDDFVAIGGYDERRYFGEDVQLLWDLKRLGWRRGQRLTRLRSTKATASMRKFDRYGDWHYFTLVLRLLPMMLFSPKASHELAQDYWYRVDR
jgi:glycosyltransferase involved in cell wall biosynthesis